MTFMWSEHAAHVQSLFRPWTPEDGYVEDVVQQAEALLGVALPGILRSFYRSWGARSDMTRRVQRLLPPQKLIMRSDALVFCVETQSICYWAIRRAVLGWADPPVSIASSGDEGSVWEGHLDLDWEESHEHVSDFLDALTYTHAFAGGAAHGGRSNEQPGDRRIALVKQHWQRIEIRSNPFYLEHDAIDRRWPIYGCKGQAIDWMFRFVVAVQKMADLDKISETLDITWDRRW